MGDGGSQSKGFEERRRQLAAGVKKNRKLSKKGDEVMAGIPRHEGQRVSLEPLDGKGDTADVSMRTQVDVDFEIRAFVWPGEGDRVGRFDLSFWVNDENDAAIVDLEVVLAGAIDNLEEGFAIDWEVNLQAWRTLLLRLISGVDRGERAMIRYREQEAE